MLPKDLLDNVFTGFHVAINLFVAKNLVKCTMLKLFLAKS